jgi:hypothetical protein
MLSFHLPKPKNSQHDSYTNDLNLKKSSPKSELPTKSYEFLAKKVNVSHCGTFLSFAGPKKKILECPTLASDENPNFRKQFQNTHNFFLKKSTTPSKKNPNFLDSISRIPRLKMSLKSKRIN